MSRVMRFLRRLLRDEGGAVAIMLTLSLIPLSIAAIGAVDLERGLSAKTQLQDALDAAALAALKASANDPALLQSTGATAFTQNLGPAPAMTIASGPTFVYGAKGMVLADATATIDTIIASWVLGHPLQVAAHAEIVRSDVKLEIAMVLDNSGSMADNNKIGDLRIGATNFLDILQTAATQRGDPNSVLISLVPFSQTVRVDPINQGASWLDMKGKAAINDQIFDKNNTRRFNLFATLGTTWAGCLESRVQPYDVQDDPATGNDTRFTPYFWPDEYDGTTAGGRGNTYLPDGSTAGWLAQEKNVSKYVKTTGLTTSRGPNKDCTMLPIRPLTNDFATLRSDVSKMAPTNDTNIGMGLVWGWHTISPNGPFANSGVVPVAPYGDPKRSKIAVVMTDGYNQFTGTGDANNITPYEAVGYVWQNRLSKPDGTPLSGGTDDDRTAALDARLAKLCINMKAKGVEIYAVAVGVAPAHQEPLKSCASGADHFYDVANGAGLIDAFNSIANQIANLRLSR